MRKHTIWTRKNFSYLAHLATQGYHSAFQNRLLDAQDNSVENDADVVMYIYREDMGEQDTMRHNIADIIVTKHRNGVCDEISLYFEPSTGRFRDLMINSARES